MAKPFYWHVLPSNFDKEPILYYDRSKRVKVGQRLSTRHPISLCSWGFHACYRLFDCLEYREGAILCKVRLGGKVQTRRDDNKVVSNSRTVVAMTSFQEGSDVLEAFARWCALEVADKWEMPEIVRRYLETNDQELRDEAHAIVNETWQASTAVDECPIAAAEVAASYRFTSWRKAVHASNYLLGCFVEEEQDAVRAKMYDKLEAMVEEVFQAQEANTPNSARGGG